jgi:hypothetical protein
VAEARYIEEATIGDSINKGLEASLRCMEWKLLSLSWSAMVAGEKGD